MLRYHSSINKLLAGFQMSCNLLLNVCVKVEMADLVQHEI